MNSLNMVLMRLFILIQATTIMHSSSPVLHLIKEALRNAHQVQLHFAVEVRRVGRECSELAKANRRRSADSVVW